MIVLEGVGLSYSAGLFGGRPARVLEGIDWTLPEGRVTGLLGPSGSGKSSLAKLVLGLVAPTAGTVRVAGKDWREQRSAGLRAMRRLVQYVPQHPDAAFNPRLRLGSSMRELFRLHGLCAPQEREARLAAALDQVGLDPALLSRYPGQVSGGEIQRLSLARALLLEPRYLVLDEATAMLDVSIQARIMRLVLDVKAERGMGVLVITHDAPLARTVCDDVFTMENGRLARVRF
jgi:peptide/nickel transport system ATP-binding protein